MQHIPDPYRVLGVQRAATLPQIKAAHRGMAKRFHPDAPEGDTGRFLAVQEAYLLLSDPIRRREWDARHAPGPVRAGEGTTRGRGRAAAGRWTREDTDAGTRRAPRPPRRGPAGEGGPSRPPGQSAEGGSRDYDTPDDAPRDPAEPRKGPHRWSASGRDPSTRSYTWTAEGVPWWEDFPGPGRSKQGGDSTRRAGRPADDPAGRQADRRRGAEGGPSGTAGPPRGTAGRPPGTDPDVYSRSSGAAWSSAARRYFRQGDSDLPSRGVFRREGTQYVTGAKARQAAATEASKATEAGKAAGGTSPAGPSPGPPKEGVLRPRPGSPGPRQAFHHEPADPPRERPLGQARDSGHDTIAPPGSSPAGTATRRMTPPPHSAAATTGPSSLRRKGVPTGPAHGVGSIGRRSADARRAIHEPTAFARRVAELSLAWLPIAAGIGYGTPAVIGCSPSGGTCPDALPSMQAILAVLVLATFVAFPRIARVGALATAAALAVAVPLLVFGALLGLLPPARPIAIAALSLVALAYLVGAGAATWIAARSGKWPGTTVP